MASCGRARSGRRASSFSFKLCNQRQFSVCGVEMTKNYKKEYFARIHRAQDFIEENIGRPLELEEIARAAHFSPFHFHRLYSALTNETLYQFIQRIRLERAASKLLQKPALPITEIALDLGFSSSATFARAFKGCFGVSASEYREAGESKNCKQHGKNGKAADATDAYPARVDFDSILRSNDMKRVQAKSIEVCDLPAKTFAYVRHVGPYAGDTGLFERLFGAVFAWAGPRGLFRPPQTELISMYHDDPAITDESNLRISVGLTVPPDTDPSGEVSLLEIPAGRYACARFEIAVDEYAAAWQALCGEWLPQSGWQPDDGPCYECYLNDPKQHPEGKHVVEIRMSVKPL